MTPKVNHKQISAENQETIRDLLQEKMKLVVRYTLIEALEEEVQVSVDEKFGSLIYRNNLCKDTREWMIDFINTLGNELAVTL